MVRILGRALPQEGYDPNYDIHVQFSDGSMDADPTSVFGAEYRSLEDAIEDGLIPPNHVALLFSVNPDISLDSVLSPKEIAILKKKLQLYVEGELLSDDESLGGLLEERSDEREVQCRTYSRGLKDTDDAEAIPSTRSSPRTKDSLGGLLEKRSKEREVLCRTYSQGVKDADDAEAIPSTRSSLRTKDSLGGLLEQRSEEREELCRTYSQGLKDAYDAEVIPTPRSIPITEDNVAKRITATTPTPTEVTQPSYWSSESDETETGSLLDPQIELPSTGQRLDHYKDLERKPSLDIGGSLSKFRYRSKSRSSPKSDPSPKSSPRLSSLGLWKQETTEKVKEDKKEEPVAKLRPKLPRSPRSLFRLSRKTFDFSDTKAAASKKAATSPVNESKEELKTFPVNECTTGGENEPTRGDLESVAPTALEQETSTCDSFEQQDEVSEKAVSTAKENLWYKNKIRAKPLDARLNSLLGRLRSDVKQETALESGIELKNYRSSRLARSGASQVRGNMKDDEQIGERITKKNSIIESSRSSGLSIADGRQNADTMSQKEIKNVRSPKNRSGSETRMAPVGSLKSFGSEERSIYSSSHESETKKHAMKKWDEDTNIMLLSFSISNGSESSSDSSHDNSNFSGSGSSRDDSHEADYVSGDSSFLSEDTTSAEIAVARDDRVYRRSSDDNSISFFGAESSEDEIISRLSNQSVSDEYHADSFFDGESVELEASRHEQSVLIHYPPVSCLSQSFSKSSSRR